MEEARFCLFIDRVIYKAGMFTSNLCCWCNSMMGSNFGVIRLVNNCIVWLNFTVQMMGLALKSINIAAIPGGHWSIMQADSSWYLIVQMQGPRKCPVIEILQPEDNVLFMSSAVQGQRMKRELSVKFKLVLMTTSLCWRGRRRQILSQNPLPQMGLTVLNIGSGIITDKMLGESV